MPTPDDERLTALLAAALAADEAVPEDIATDARAVYAWRTIDADLIALGFDSAVDGLAGVRSAAGAIRLLRFSSGGVEVEVDVHAGGLDGLVTGAGIDEVELERPDGSAFASPVDELGRFRFDSVASGPARLRLLGPETRRVTEWFLLSR